MDLKEAKEFIKNSWLFNTANENIRLKEAITTILQELDNLQKENEELNTFIKRIEDKDLDEANIRAEAMLDMDKIWRNKIKEKIEECEKFIIDDENFSPLHKNDKELLENLLRE